MLPDRRDLPMLQCCCRAEGKSRAAAQYNKKRLKAFHIERWDLAHRATDYDKWTTATDFYDIEYEHVSGCDTQWLRCRVLCTVVESAHSTAAKPHARLCQDSSQRHRFCICPGATCRNHPVLQRQ